MLSPIHALLGEEFQDSLLPMITAQMKVATLAALRATCKDGRRAATAEYDTVEAHAFFRAARDKLLREHPPMMNKRSICMGYALRALVRSGRLRAYEQHAIRWRMHLKPEDAAWTAAQAGHIHILDWMHNRNTPRLFSGLKVCEAAADGGQLETLKWLRAQEPPLPWTKRIFDYALNKGHVHVLEWALDNGCPRPDDWKSRVIAHALNVKSLHVVEWALDHGCTSLDHLRSRVFNSSMVSRVLSAPPDAKGWNPGFQAQFDAHERFVNAMGPRLGGVPPNVSRDFQRAQEILREARLREGL